MFRKELPRLYEFKDQCHGTDSYFRGFDEFLQNDQRFSNSAAMRVYSAYEKILQELDITAWELLKEKSCQDLTKKGNSPGRSWEQAFNFLNEARGYMYLKSLGCVCLKFIPPSKKKGIQTPDLQGRLDSMKVLCEVKTINISDKEAQCRSNGSCGTISNQLEQGFLNKLTCDLNKAKQQLEAFGAGEGVRRIAFINIRFDDFFTRCKEEYYQQIDEYLSENNVSGIEIVFYNEVTGFHRDIYMKSATIVNEQPLQI